MKYKDLNTLKYDYLKERRTPFFCPTLLTADRFMAPFKVTTVISFIAAMNCTSASGTVPLLQDGDREGASLQSAASASLAILSNVYVREGCIWLFLDALSARGSCQLDHYGRRRRDRLPIGLRIYAFQFKSHKFFC